MRLKRRRRADVWTAVTVLLGLAAVTAWVRSYDNVLISSFRGRLALVVLDRYRGEEWLGVIGKTISGDRWSVSFPESPRGKSATLVEWVCDERRLGKKDFERRLSWGGFELRRGSYLYWAARKPCPYLLLTVPYWSLVALTVLMLALRGAVLLRAAGRRRAGRCARCGYDLRGTPGRCPECGSVPEVNT